MIQYFYPSPGSCPYLPDQIEQKEYAFIDDSTIAMEDGKDEFYRSYIDQGFRRSHNVFYRNMCNTCAACLPCRTDVFQFKPNRTMRKTLRLDLDLTKTKSPTQEHYNLFLRYQECRHSGGEMSKLTFQHFSDLVRKSPVNTFMVEFRDKLKLVGVALIDGVSDGWSGNYQIFDPDYLSKSIGTYMILRAMEEMKKEGLQYYYLGFWVKGAKTMEYKKNFQPMEVLIDGKWTAYSEDL